MIVIVFSGRDPITICTVEEQAGDRWFLEKIRYDAGSSPVARSRADFIAGCYQMWRHNLAHLVDTRYSTYMYMPTHSSSCSTTTYSTRQKKLPINGRPF